MAQQFDNTLQEIGARDLSVAVTLHDALRVGTEKLKDPIAMAKIRAISSFLDGDIDPVFTIQRVIRSNKNPGVENIDHLFQFVQMSKAKSGLEEEMEKLNKELKYFE